MEYIGNNLDDTLCNVFSANGPTQGEPKANI